MEIRLDSRFWYIQICFWPLVIAAGYLAGVFTAGQDSFLWLVAAIHIFFSLIISTALAWAYKFIPDEKIKLTIIMVVLMSCLAAILCSLLTNQVALKLMDIARLGDMYWQYAFTNMLIFLCWSSTVFGVQFYWRVRDEHDDVVRVQAQINEEQRKLSEAQSLARESKLQMLRYQLTPHFLSNTLNAINSLIEVGANEKAQKMTVQLSRFLRYSLDNNPVTTLPLEKEMNAIQLYLDIEKTRFGDRLNLDFVIGERAKSALVPSLLIQPIIENSMKHVIARNEDGGTISLVADVIEKQLVLELSDTGVVDAPINRRQRTRNAGSQNRGVGLRNIDERLKALYVDKYSFEIFTLSSGALKTIIKIPYQPEMTETKSETLDW